MKRRRYFKKGTRIVLADQKITIVSRRAWDGDFVYRAKVSTTRGGRPTMRFYTHGLLKRQGELVHG